MEEAGDILQHRLCKGWERVSTTKLLQKRVNVTASGAGLVPAVPCSPPPAWKGARARWGPGPSAGKTAERRGTGACPRQQDEQPGPRTWLSSHQGHGRGRMSRRRKAGGRGGVGCSPPGCWGGGEEQTEGQRKAPKEWRDTRRRFRWPRRVRGRRAPSWQQDTAGGPGLAWAGAMQKLSPGAGRDGGRDGGAGYREVPRQGHLIPPGASCWEVQHPNPGSADAVRGQTCPGSPPSLMWQPMNLPPLAKESLASRHPLSLPGGAAPAWCFFGISHLRHGQAKHFRRRSRAASAQGRAGNPGNITKAAKKTQLEKK